MTYHIAESVCVFLEQNFKVTAMDRDHHTFGRATLDAELAEGVFGLTVKKLLIAKDVHLGMQADVESLKFACLLRSAVDLHAKPLSNTG